MARKLDSEEIVEAPTVSSETSQAIMQGRQKKGWTQVQLAKEISEKVTVVESYENGSAIAENRIIAAMEKALGCQLPRVAKKKKPKVKKGFIADDDWQIT
eukprot:TRINITY_DN5485_c0_g1_i1.p1 TRINITY_DN5485_c0_g1~~TRINITY_DN5485_c0_g1_i1.p1  ORF type:complete len:100 (-),score=27.88 TRINITY_DN5485_c0_g1_i1:80-379(-)